MEIKGFFAFNTGARLDAKGGHIPTAGLADALATPRKHTTPLITHLPRLNNHVRTT